jgi:hypothetical protein
VLVPGTISVGDEVAVDARSFEPAVWAAAAIS